MQTETLIIGGGLSGLRLAVRLSEEGQDFQLLEARPRFGGRILTQKVGEVGFDLGPAWFWPGQPRMAALMRELRLSVFEQYADGVLTFEDESGQVQRGRGFASMEGSYRLSGGLGALIDALVSKLPEDRLHQNAQVDLIQKTQEGVSASTTNGARIEAKRIVFALPLRLACQLAFTPALDPTAQQVMAGTATWMAGQAKALAVYETPFWREAGLSGDAMSCRGPMVEIHDASPAVGGPYALFGFIGISPEMRRNEAALKQAVVGQLVRLFGAKAGDPEKVFVKDWAFDPFTASALDRQPLYTHPSYGLPDALDDLWDGRLLFSGTETGRMFGGYLEGALEAADATFDQILKQAVQGAR